MSFIIVILIGLLFIYWTLKRLLKLSDSLNAKLSLIPPALKGQFKGQAFEVYFGKGENASYTVTLFHNFFFEAGIYKNKGVATTAENYWCGKSYLPKATKHATNDRIVFAKDVVEVESFMSSETVKEAIMVLFKIGFYAILIDKHKIVIKNDPFDLFYDFELARTTQTIKKALECLNVMCEHGNQ
jgi:hypothetical protein